MKESENIARLQKEIEAAKQRMANCKHVFNKPIYDPETIREPYGYKAVGHGSDVWTEPEGYHDVEKPRWSRECSICGHKEYSYILKPIITGSEPKF